MPIATRRAQASMHLSLKHAWQKDQRTRGRRASRSGARPSAKRGALPSVPPCQGRTGGSPGPFSTLPGARPGKTGAKQRGAVLHANWMLRRGYGDLQPTSSRWGRIPAVLDCLHRDRDHYSLMVHCCQHFQTFATCQATLCESAPVPPPHSSLLSSTEKTADFAAVDDRNLPE